MRSFNGGIVPFPQSVAENKASVLWREDDVDPAIHMPAYLVAEVEWHNPEVQKEYNSKLKPTLEKYHARTLAVGAPEVLEGDWNPRRVVLIEFPSMEALQSWYRSTEYSPLISLRQSAARTNIVAVSG